MKYFLIIAMLLIASCTKKAPDPTEARPEKKNPVVLLIGDSHTAMLFGARLASVTGAKRYGISSATARTWTDDTIKKGTYKWGYATPDKVSDAMLPDGFPGAARLIKQWNPDVILIALGTNDADNYCQSGNVEGIKTLLSQVSGVQKCGWIGPPQYNKSCQNGYIDKMQAVIEASKCYYVDSRRIKVKANTPDGVHFTGGPAEEWAATAWAMLTTHDVMVVYEK